MRVTEDESAKRLAVSSDQDDVLAVARALAAALCRVGALNATDAPELEELS